MFYPGCVAANPSKLDMWPPYDPNRFVLIRHKERWNRPTQGFLLEWRRWSGHWYGVVIYVAERTEPHASITWLFPARRLFPIIVDPNIVDRPHLTLPVRVR